MKKTHLMYQHTPFSACGRYVGSYYNSGMLQVFKIEETTCKMCLLKLEEYKANSEANKSEVVDEI